MSKTSFSGHHSPGLPLLLLALLAAAPLRLPADPSGTLFPERAEAGDKTLHLSGTATYVYRIFFKVYDAALYLERGSSAESVLSDSTARRLEIVYSRELEAELLAESGRTILARSFPAERLAALEKEIDRISAWYADVEKGDSYALTYIPGEGTTLARNGDPVGTIAGSEFARIYFSIWLGDNAVKESVRRDLLAGLREPTDPAFSMEE